MSEKKPKEQPAKQADRSTIETILSALAKAAEEKEPVILVIPIGGEDSERSKTV